MCYASLQVIRKVFDYDAYIQGRLRGEYVVIYNTIIEEAQQITAHVQQDVAVTSVNDTLPIVPKPALSLPVLFKDNTDASIVCTTTAFGNMLTGNRYFESVNRPPFHKTKAANCRGAPQ